jgi:hypothetical protein
MAIWVPLLAGLAGLIAGSSIGKKKKEEPQVVTQPALHPEQEKMISDLGKYISDNLGKPLEQYSGSYVAPITQQQKNAMSNLENLTWNFTPQVTQNAKYASDALIRALNTDAGMKEAEDYYQQAIHNQALKSFQEEILPTIQKAYAGPGTYWGSDRAGAVKDASTDLAGQLAGIRAQIMFDTRNALENRALQAAAQIHQYEQFMQNLGLAAEQARTGFGLNKSSSLFDMGEIIRQAEQLELDRQYSEWLRTRPENSPYLQAALNFMGLPTTVSYGVPKTPGLLQQLLQLAPELLATYLVYGGMG